MKDWTFGRRLGLGFALLAALAVVTVFVAWRALLIVVEEKDNVILNAGQDAIDAEHLNATMHAKAANSRAYILSPDEVHLRAVEENDADFLKTLEALKARAQSERQQDVVSDIAAAYRLHADVVRRALEQQQTAPDPETVSATYSEQVIPKFDALGQKVMILVENARREREAGRKDASLTAASARTILLGTAAFTTLAAALIAAYLTQVLTHQISESIHHIRSSAAELQAAATQQASGAREQAAAMREISTTMGELLATSRQIAASGQNVAKMAKESASSAHSGKNEVKRAWEAVNAIKQQVDAIVQHMLALGKKSQQIGGVLEIINELAEQTNILAINATIEAAGAGEAGRRFSVVGEEIRKLSSRVGGSTREIRELIDEIRAAVNSTIMATEAGAKTVDAGTERFGELESMFSRIADVVVATTEAGQEISLSTKQQATAVEQVNTAISNVAQATRETEASSGQTLQTASQLTNLSEQLTRLVKPKAA